MRLVARVARDHGNVRCPECGEFRELRSDGRAVRHLGKARYYLWCKNEHKFYIEVEPYEARRLGLPPPYGDA
jgi:hypothetical protein